VPRVYKEDKRSNEEKAVGREPPFGEDLSPEAEE
jgi:hypothetical protein